MPAHLRTKTRPKFKEAHESNLTAGCRRTRPERYNPAVLHLLMSYHLRQQDLPLRTNTFAHRPSTQGSARMPIAIRGDGDLRHLPVRLGDNSAPCRTGRTVRPIGCRAARLAAAERCRGRPTRSPLPPVRRRIPADPLEGQTPTEPRSTDVEVGADTSSATEDVWCSW